VRRARRQWLSWGAGALLTQVVAAISTSGCGGISQERRVIVDHGGAAPAGGSGFAETGGAGDAGGAVDASGAGDAGEGGAAGDAGHSSCLETDANRQGDLELITLSTSCDAADGDSTFSRLTPDGRYVVFDSDAPDLVPHDANGSSDGFLFDFETRKLELISKKNGSDVPALGHTFLLVPSDDARYVAFTALSYELTQSTVPEGFWVYVRDRRAGTTRRLPGDYACAQDVDMSGNGELIVVQGFTNCQGRLESGDYDSLVEYDLTRGSQRLLGSIERYADNFAPSISRNGRFTLWAVRPPMTRGQLTSRLQIEDRTTGVVETLPIDSFHFESTAVSESGDVIAFSQYGQVYRYVRGTDELTLVSKTVAGGLSTGTSSQVSMTADGRMVVFRTTSPDLIADDTNGVADVYLYDAARAESESLARISVAADGTEADGESQYPYISADGSKVSFVSKARNLLPAATRGNFQLYVRTLGENRNRP
jgi:Tol biopolymer transport system component